MILTADTNGERLDAYLARSIENMSRSGAQKLLEDGCVLLNGGKAKKNDKLKIGDEISVTIPEPKTEPTLWEDIVWFMEGLFA